MENSRVKLERLSDTIYVQTGDVHRFGTDAFLLADFASPRKKDIVCDLGTGCGIIPMLFQKRQPPKTVYGVDIQQDAIEQFKAALAVSEVGGEVIPVCADLKNLPADILPFGRFDAVTCNPPYKVSGGGVLSEAPGEQIARHETLCTIDDVCRAACRLLKFSGKLYICQRPERLCDVMLAMRSNGIEPKRLRLVSKTAKDAPWLFLLEGQKGAKPFMKILPPLFLYKSNRVGEEYTEEMQRIYRMEE